MTTVRVMRCGSWSNEARYVRCARRLAIDAVRCDGFYGFRPVAKAIPPDSARVLRGGSWLYIAQYVRCARRTATAYGPGSRSAIFGFRPVAKVTS